MGELEHRSSRPSSPLTYHISREALDPFQMQLSREFADKGIRYPQIPKTPKPQRNTQNLRVFGDNRYVSRTTNPSKGGYMENESKKENNESLKSGALRLGTYTAIIGGGVVAVSAAANLINRKIRGEVQPAAPVCQ